MNRAEATPLEQLLALPNGERRLGPFVLDRQLGRGGFAPVWLAREIHGETCLRSAALKLFNVEREADRFAAVIEEARVLASVVHPNVVHFYQLVLDEGRGVAGLAMELVSGESVARQLAQRRRLPVDEVVRVGVAVASALSAVHRAGLVHRDIKPENVVAAGGTYKLIDFGIAAGSRPAPAPRARRVLLDELPLEIVGASLSDASGAFTPNPDDLEGPTLLQDLQGTIGYMDPATVALGLPESVESDLYGLGVLLFECVTGRLPAVVSAGARGGMDGAVLDGRKRAPGLRSVDPSVPEPLASLVDSLLKPQRSGRPASSEWILAELERIDRAIREGLLQALPSEEDGPFRGLAGYHEADAGVFFQREGETAAVIELLRRSGLVVIRGRMGSGKSSLMRAGVIPAVRRGALEPSIKSWVVASCLVGRDLRGAMARALGVVIPDAYRLKAGELVVALSEHVKATGTGVLLALDQLEDLMALAGDTSRRYGVELLSALVAAPAGLRCVATLRRDFREALEDAPVLKSITVRSAFFLAPLNRDAWAEVIARGLAVYDYRADDALEPTLNEAFDESDMVQRGFVLSVLWRERDRSARTLSSRGRSREAHAAELSHRADASLRTVTARFGDAAREAARQLLLSLVTTYGTRVPLVSEEIQAIGRRDMMENLVTTLEDEGLIVREGEQLLLAHEALTQSWGTLSGWYQQAAHDRTTAEQIERDALRYAESLDPDILRSWSGERQKQALALWIQRRAKLSAAADSFLSQLAVHRSDEETRTLTTTKTTSGGLTGGKRSEPSAAACLVVVHARTPDLLGKRFLLEYNPTRIGRGVDNQVVLDGNSASRRHAYCERAGEGWRIVDDGSTNGTYVNDEQIARAHLLRSGDRIRIGQTMFKYLAGPDPEAQYHEEIYRMAILDGLTQIFNKRYLIEALEREIIRVRRPGRAEWPIGFILFDIDQFKQFNEYSGNLAGDAVLCDMVKRLSPLLPREHVLARYGGDEFVVLCPESDLSSTASLANSLREAVASHPFTFQGGVLRVTASFGVAQLHERMRFANDLIREAEQKLREAKDAGRNCVVG